METKPLDDLESLFDAELSQIPKSRVSLAKASARFKFVENEKKKMELKRFEDAPKTLFCHDFKNGYHEDRFTDGCSDIADEPYHFDYWSYLDTFVYFSHHFITIPPTGWIDVAHRHGVKVLGTLITEFDHGKKMWQQILASQKTMDKFVKRCTEIMEHVGFDGWLMNVENEIAAEDVDKVIEITRELSKRCHVIWFDSVTIEGKLDWQNELNEKNKPFFEACHGIFLNYTWTEAGLHTTVDNAGLSRLHDIYVGIDVFGRGCPGGGGFRSDFALNMIREHNLSAAIFAPGWTHEKKTVNEDFFTMNKIFWQLLEPHMYMHGPAEAIGFETGFKSGCFRQENKLWTLDLANQDIMPSFLASEVVYKKFWQAGCGLNDDNIANLFVCDIPVKSKMSFVINLDREVESIELKLLFDLATAVSLDQPSKKAEAGVDGVHELVVTIDNEAGLFKCLNFVSVVIKMPPSCRGSTGILKKFAVCNSVA